MKGKVFLKSSPSIRVYNVIKIVRKELFPSYHVYTILRSMCIQNIHLLYYLILHSVYVHSYFIGEISILFISRFIQQVCQHLFSETSGKFCRICLFGKHSELPPSKLVLVSDFFNNVRFFFIAHSISRRQKWVKSKCSKLCSRGSSTVNGVRECVSIVHLDFLPLSTLFLEDF